jgi:xanthine/CO dehydrogenase XdhC/CoxF family maturation factor
MIGFCTEERSVHLGTPALLDFFRRHDGGRGLVLATIIGTEGSTYRKPGAMMLIAEGGEYEGLISGGCLEGDLLHHAREVFESGNAKHVTYDMSAGEDLVWNLGLGCDGVIHLLLQRLDGENGADVFRQLARSHERRRATLLALCTGSGEGSQAGRMAVLDTAGEAAGDPELSRLLEVETGHWPQWRTKSVESKPGAAARDVMLIHMPAQVRVLICGAGPDALPVARVLSELDWQVYVVDHRPAFARPDRFPGTCHVLQSRPEGLGEAVDLDQFEAAVIMSHHLENDAAYLKQLSDSGAAYIGTLGPRARRARLQELAGCEHTTVHGPVGLDIGAELPAAIALSIAAEIHAVLNCRDGHSLTGVTHEHPA